MDGLPPASLPDRRGRSIDQEDVGNLGLFLLSPLASGITGETVYVDSGYHIMGMQLDDA